MGLASYAQFRGGAGYAIYMKHSILLTPGTRGAALGFAEIARMPQAARKFGRFIDLVLTQKFL